MLNAKKWGDAAPRRSPWGFAQLYETPAVELTGTRVATDDPVTVALLNPAPALLKQFDMQRLIERADQDKHQQAEARLSPTTRRHP